MLDHRAVNGLFLLLGLGCAPHRAPGLEASRMARRQLVSLELHRVVLAGQVYECAFQVWNDGETVLLPPPEPVRVVCAAAYHAWEQRHRS